ncbi:hypothetical protein R3P38DRAFT_897213 [Favolaschia claudopus]|uniref:DUF6535 domain-containing protein n=1 Tax=Favolaschia claudopus TaxID=2862362 RepID=A0AAW0BTS3_9AGAR
MFKCRNLPDFLPLWHNPKSHEAKLDAGVDPLLDDSPCKQYCGPNAEVWKKYLTSARRFDDGLVNSLNNSVDPLLIFASLFSAILTAFLIEIRTEKTTNSLLFSIVLGEHTISDDSPFQPVSAFRWINGLWFTSLLFSLGSALGASVAKGWTTPFSTTTPGSGWSNACAHSKRWCGTQRWHLNFFVQSLPLLIHTALFLFGAGLAILLFQDDRPIAIVILTLMAIVGGAYLAPTVLRATFHDFPFRTPISEVTRMLSTGWFTRAVTPFPSIEGAQKAFALAWLLRNSLDDETTDAAIRAVAGLPFTIPVQDELVRGITASTISNRLSAELLKDTKDPAFLRQCLFALLHLVQTKPLDSEALRTLHDMVDSRNIESMPTGVHEVALCVKGRILLFYEPGTEQCEDAFFETDIRVLANCCHDPCLLRSLREVYRLRVWRTPPAHEDFASLTSTQTCKRRAAHAKLTKEASQNWVTSIPTLRGEFFKQALSSNFARSEVASFLAAASEYKAISEIVKSSAIYESILTDMTMQNGFYYDLITPFLVLSRHTDLRESLATVVVWRNILQYCSRGSREATDAMQEFRKLVKYDDVGKGVIIPEIESQLIQFLGSELSSVRESTIGLFVDISPKHLTASALLPKLVSLLDDESDGPRQAAVRLFNWWAQHLSADDKTTSIIWEQIYGIKLTRQSLVSLSDLILPNKKIFEAEIPDVGSIPGLIQTFEAEENGRYAAVRGICFLVKHSTVTGPMVTNLLVHMGSWVSDTASEAIQAIASRDGFGEAILSQGAQQQITKLLYDATWFVRRDMLRMLTNLAKDGHGAFLATPIIPHLSQAVTDSDEDVRETAINLAVSLYDYSHLSSPL